MHTDRKRYYALLGLDPSSSIDDIRIAFRRRAKELHPDAETGDATAFIRLKRAYDTLNDPAARARYDRASTARVRRAMSTASEPPLPQRTRSSRSGGVGIVRYFVAFLFMGGLSFGAIEAMISYAEPPAAAASHPVSLLTTETGKGDLRAGRTSSVGNGFWDPTSPDGTPRDPASDTPRKRSNALGAFTAE